MGAIAQRLSGVLAPALRFALRALLTACTALLAVACAVPERPSDHAGAKTRGVVSSAVTKPVTISAAQWGSNPLPIPEAQRHTPTFITIHHAGVRWKPGSDPAASARALQKFGQNQRAWPDVPYHFLIAPDGRILEGRALRYAPQSNTAYNVAGHIGVQMWGNFDEERAGLAQLEAVVRLLAWLSQEHNIDLAELRGHRHWVQTACPGKDLDRYVTDGHLSLWAKNLLVGRPPGDSPLVAVLPPLPQGPFDFIPFPIERAIKP